MGIARRVDVIRRHHGDGVSALDVREGVDEGALQVGRLGAGDEVHEHFRVGHRVEDCPLGFELLAELLAVHEVAVVGDGDGAFVGRRHERLGVAEHRPPGRRVADVAEGRVARQLRDAGLVEDVGDVAHVLLAEDAVRAGFERGDPGALLPAVLQGVQPEVDEVGRILVVEDAEDTALFSELVEHHETDRNSI